MIPLRPLCILLAAAVPAIAVSDVALQDPAPPTWNKDVRPLLAESCFLCHGPDISSREAELRLDIPEGYTADRGGYRAVEPGDPEESELIWRVSEAEGEDAMPPDGHGERLTAEQVDVLRRWIAAGAKWESHWAYRPFHEVEVPLPDPSWGSLSAYRAWPRNEIDRFVVARLAAADVLPAPEADRRSLIRRLSLDLRGLPPTPEEVEAFVAAESEQAYAELVDQFLADPAFAVRWARHWLDLARYSDSHGFTVDGPRTMWPWRDWVVDAIDADMSFDRFTIEQLAGDLLPDATRSTRLATGFHRNTQVNQEGGAKDEENRVNAVLDRANTTGAVWLGSTAGCAQCHDHKFDPMTQKEYFQLYAFYNTTADGGVSAEPALMVPPPDSAAKVEAWEKRDAELRAAVMRHRTADLGGLSAWKPWRVSGSNGPEFRPQADGSWRVIGQNPVYSTYFLEGPVPDGGVTTIMIEALPDSGLRKGGPGRSGSGNFVLQQVRLYARGKEDGWSAVALKEGRATFSQDTRSTGGGQFEASTVTGDGPGWAVSPEANTPHSLFVDLASPLADETTALRLELVQEYGGNHTLGRFRVVMSERIVGDLVHGLRSTGAAAWIEATDYTPERLTAWADYAEHQRSRPRVPSSLVLQESEVLRTTQMFHRGSFQDLGEVVTPGYPAAMNHFGAKMPAGNRLDLARWLTHPENALVWRVTVNRWWQQLFGIGLVPTQDDFGFRGTEPTHPELLEWLAQELVQNGYSRKQLLRTIVMSATYRQSALPRPEVDARPDTEQLLARQQRLPLDGEVLRDSALQASGLIDMTRGGPPVQPPQPEGVFSFTQSRRSWKPSEGSARFRRSLYTRLWRSAPYPFYTTFDLPAATISCTRRARSNTPLQALAMANDPMMMELAVGFARDLATTTASDELRIDSLFRRALARRPTDEEADALRRYLQWSRGPGIEIQREVRPEDPELHAWTALSRLVFNLDEFLTRP